MAKPVELTDAEIEFILHLLQAETRELPTEIHHSDTFKMRKELRARQKMTDDLIARLRGLLPPSASQS